MSLYDLSKPAYEAGQTVRRLSQQVTSIGQLLNESGDVPESLAADVDSLESDLRQLSEDITEASRDNRLTGAIEGSWARPTADQLWQIDRAWERIPALIERVNEIISDRLPAIHRQMNEHGIRPDPGETIAVPRRPGR